MAGLQGVLRFPGVQYPAQWQMTLSHGISPSTCAVEIRPQESYPELIGTMKIEFGDTTLSFPDCIVDTGTISRGSNGMIVGLSILDRRWRWKFTEVSGRYNVRKKNGFIYEDSLKTMQQLAEACLEAMGEQGYDVSAMPNDMRPEIDWVAANAAQELSSLCDMAGCRVVLGLDDKVRICKVGVGAELPNNGLHRNISYGFDPPNRPGSLKVITGPTRYQSMFRLEPVAEEESGEIVLLNDASYKPSDGWGNEMFFEFGNITNEKDREAAKKSVYKYFRIKCSAEFDERGKFKIPGLDEDVEVRELWQLLPLEKGLVLTYLDADQVEQPYKALLSGDFWNRGLDGKNREKALYSGKFDIDEERGLVITDEPVVKLGDNGTLEDPALFLEIAHGVKETDRTLIWYEQEYTLPGDSFGAGPQIIRREDLRDEYVAVYDGDRNVTRVDHDNAELLREVRFSLEAAAAEFQTRETGDVEYAGVIAIEPDGAICQVGWSGGPGGSFTRASRNSEFSVKTVPFKERRLLEKLRTAGEEQSRRDRLARAASLRMAKGGK